MIILLLLFSTYIKVPRLVNTYWFNEDFVGGGTASGTFGQMGWWTNISGGELGYANDQSDKCGVGFIGTSLDISGRASIYGNPMFLAKDMVIEVLARLNAVGTSSDPFEVTFGLGDVHTSGLEHENGLYFKYDWWVGSTWYAVSARAQIRTSVNTGVTVGTSWTKFKIRVNATKDTVEYYINDVLVATITTNLPIAYISPGCKILKSGGSQRRTFYIDYYQIYSSNELGR